MSLVQGATLIAGLMLAAASVTWAVLEIRRDKRAGRHALIRGPFGGGTVWVALVALVVLVPLLYVVFAFELVPKGSPLLYVVTLGWIATAWIAAMFAGVAIQVRRNAEGWLTMVDARTLRVEAEGTTTTLELGENSARLYLVDPGRRLVQFLISDGSEQVRVWGMVSIRGLQDVTEGPPVSPRGLMLAGSAEPLRKWLSPFIVSSGSAG